METGAAKRVSEDHQSVLFKQLIKSTNVFLPQNVAGTCQINGYRWIDGIEQLLLDLDKSGAEMHIITNYPMWYKRIEDKLAVSRHLPWTFVSCEGPMKGLRKPEAECYEAVAAHLGVEPQRITLIDDRQVNVVGALEQGWNVHLFQNVPALRKDLRKKRILRNMAGPFDPPPPTMIR